MAPENSLAAFRRALDDGADAIETDLWSTADGVIVCHHDRTLGRMAGDPRHVGQVRLAELKRVRLLSPDRRPTAEAVPTLAELLDLTPQDVPLVLELKDPGLAAPGKVAALAAMLGDRLTARRVVVVSFSLGRLLAARRAVPGLPIGHITLRLPVPAQPCDLLGPYWPLLVINPWYVRMAHAVGRRVCPLDPGLHSRLDRYVALGVDAVLTNDPAATRQRLDAAAGW